MQNCGIPFQIKYELVLKPTNLREKLQIVNFNMLAVIVKTVRSLAFLFTFYLFSFFVWFGTCISAALKFHVKTKLLYVFQKLINRS